MKRTRIFLATTAVLFAIGGAFASKLQNPVYLWESAIPRCTAVQLDCFTAGSAPCKISSEGDQLRKDNNTSTSCGVVMYFE